LQPPQANLAIPLQDTHWGRFNPIAEADSDNNVVDELFWRLDLLVEEILHCLALAARLCLLDDGDGIVSREDGGRLRRPLSSFCEVGFRGESMAKELLIWYSSDMGGKIVPLPLVIDPDRGFLQVLSELQDGGSPIPAVRLWLLLGLDNRSTDLLFIM